MSHTERESAEPRGDRILANAQRHLDRAASVEEPAERVYHVRSAAQLLIADTTLRKRSVGRPPRR